MDQEKKKGNCFGINTHRRVRENVKKIQKSKDHRWGDHSPSLTLRGE